MHWLQTVEVVVLFLTAAILMWDNKSATEGKPLQVRVRTRRDQRRGR